MTTTLITIDPTLFGAYDIRGRHGRNLNEREARLIGRAVGTAAMRQGQPQVVVGRDGRLHSRALARALMTGLVKSGCEVTYLGLVPTPVVQFAGIHLGIGNTVMVTGSHNPPDYNGFKIALGGESLHDEGIRRLFQAIRRRDFVSGRGSSRRLRILDDYIDDIRRRISPGRRLRIGIDCGHGAASVVAERLFRSLGCEVHALYCTIDGRFPVHHPDPARPENLKALSALVRNEGLDLGLAFDGDGDRLGAVDDRGQPLAADELLMLFSSEVLSRHPHGAVLYDVKCSRLLGEVIRRSRGHPIMGRSGHSVMKSRMREEGALLAGEYSGHLFFADRWYGFDDGLYAGARLVELASLSPEPLSRWHARLPARKATPELTLPFEHPAQALGFMHRFAERFDTRDAREVLTIDGLRVEYPDGWFLVRPSNTMPAIVLRMEADDGAALERIRDRVRQAFQTIEPDRPLPF